MAGYNNNIMKRLLDRMLFAIFFIITFFTPIITVNFTAELYEFPKIFFLYFFGSALIFLFLLKYIIFEDKIIFPNKLLLGFIFVFMISVTFSSHLYTSIWGYYSRFNDGLSSTLLFLGIYFVGINILNKEKIEILINTIILSSIPISVHGFTQISTVERVYSTLGQPNWLAAYYLLVIFLILRKIIILLNNKQNHMAYLLSLYFVLTLIVFIFTKSLSGFIGLGLAIIYILFLLSRKLKKIKLAILFGAVLLVMLIGGYFLRHRLYDALNFSTDPESYNISDPGLIRLGLWKGSLLMWLSNPKIFLFGTGPETFTYNFAFFRQDILNYSSEWDFILNKPHNYYLEILTETGFLFFIFYLSILYKVFKSPHMFIKISMVGFLASNIFGWPTVATGYLFWLYICFTDILSRDIKSTNVKI
ncbi:hypothetical protein A2V49_00560 [candidate division WWE3 bacterium RBG_19FT_COMBO_34_6]|uniref:O-antigen ligase-related domain-containing protein n=1 Tax=candidate division WWE3 bacterium RBG_19FT_COMBO_34_6 TaxID=1802612 RepID=A0A1F4UNH7_UNCKA|nr:MAG: hypothetical protein A2V49_00560 [candidate division WWE3 bacterium RBG_19FT_COMBO_34_6]